MDYTHEKTGTTYQIGRLFDPTGKSFDITVITNWLIHYSKNIVHLHPFLQ